MYRPTTTIPLLSLRRGWPSEWPGRMYRNRTSGPILIVSRHQPHPLHHAHAAVYSSKDRMLPIEERGRLESYEELTAVRVGTCVCHTNNSGASVLQVAGNFVGKLPAVDALPPATCAGRVTPLDHEVSNYPVEDRTVVVARIGQRCHVVARSGSVAVVKLDNEGADARVELYVGVGLVVGGRICHGCVAMT